MQGTKEAVTADRYVPELTAEELAGSNEALLAPVDSWINDGNEQEQREPLAVLKESLSKDQSR